MITKKCDFKFDMKIAEYIRVRRIIPIVIGNMALNHFLEGFRNDGRRTDLSADGWAQRKKTEKRKTRRAILTGFPRGGALRKSIKVIRATPDEIIIASTGVIYAETHNEGDPKRNIPQREFLGNSKVLEQKINAYLTNKIGMILKK